MKKLFRHVAGVIIFSFVACLFLPLSIYAGEPTSSEVMSSNVTYWGQYYYQYHYSMEGYDSSTEPILFYIDNRKMHPDDYPENSDTRIQYFVALTNTRLMFTFVNYKYSGKTENDMTLSSQNTGGNFWFEDATGHRHYYTYGPSANVGSLSTWNFNVQPVEVSSMDELRSILLNDDISDYLPANTDGYKLDKSLGIVKNAKWKHLESKDELHKLIQDAINLGTGTGDPGAFDYKEIYTRYAKFVQDKCSFATTSSTGVKIGGRFQLQYASRVGFTFAYNLPDLLEGTDYTKQYYKKFGSPKPYPIVNGTNFDANENIQSLFTQAYAWNDSLPSVGNWRRALVFKETKYWIDVRIIDNKNKTYGSWYAMDMETNKGSEVTTDNGDIDGDITSDDPADPYAKIEGEGDTFKDAEDNSHDVGDHTDHYDQKWYDDIKDNTKKSAPAFKNLLAMVKGIPSMIKTLFSWLPSWVLELVSVFFALVIALALLRFVLGS